MTEVDRRDGVVRVSYSGPATAVLSCLAAAGVSRVRSHEPTLEEVFLSYYDATPGQRRAVAQAHGGSR